VEDIGARAGRGGHNEGNNMQSIAAWLAGTTASAAIQKTFWIIPVMQTIHIICVAMVFSSVVMIELRVLGIFKSQTIEQIAHRYVPWVFSGVVVLALTGSVLIIGEPARSLPSDEFQMKMLALAIALGFTAAFARSVERHAPIWVSAGGAGSAALAGGGSSRIVVNVLALLAFLAWVLVVVYGRWIAYTVVH
jgi:hypothetical protein